MNVPSSKGISDRNARLAKSLRNGMVWSDARIQQSIANCESLSDPESVRALKMFRNELSMRHAARLTRSKTANATR